MASTEELQRAKETLKQECEELWHELQAVQKDVSKSATPINTTDPLIDIYREKEKVLKAQIEILKQHKVTVQDPSVYKLTIKDKLSTLNKQLEETLFRIKENYARLELDMRKAETLKKEQEQVKATLEERVKEEENQAGNPDAAAVEAQIQEQISKYSAYYKKTLKEFLPFVRQHYPAPDPNESKNKSRSASQDTGNDVMSLSNMLEQLMNKSIESPGDPYITIDPNVHWQPYIELLQRSGITLRHPNNENLIKITPFHL